MSRKEIQRERNEQCGERHVLAVDRLRRMVSEETAAEKYRPFFQDTAIFLLELENVRRKISDGVWESYSPEQMKSLNEILYSDILEENYSESYANPAYAAEKFGQEMGALLCCLYAEMRSGIPYSFEEKKDYLHNIY